MRAVDEWQTISVLFSENSGVGINGKRQVGQCIINTAALYSHLLLPQLQPHITSPYVCHRLVLSDYISVIGQSRQNADEPSSGHNEGKSTSERCIWLGHRRPFVASAAAGLADYDEKNAMKHTQNVVPVLDYILYATTARTSQNGWTVEQDRKTWPNESSAKSKTRHNSAEKSAP
jgi:hypothetical protein